MQNRAFAALVTLVALSAPGASGAAAVFTDPLAFHAAAGAVLVETFDARAIARAPSIRFDNGVTVTVGGRNAVSDNPNEVRAIAGDNRYVGFLQGDGFRSITFDFGRDVFAFAGLFTVSPLAENTVALSGVFDGVAQTVDIGRLLPRPALPFLPAPEGFFGLVSETAFRSVSFVTPRPALVLPGQTVPFGGASFTLDDLALSAPTPAPVPLPPAFVLSLGAFAGLGALRAARRRLGAGPRPA